MSGSEDPQRIVVVGNGMMGWKFCDRLSTHEGATGSAAFVPLIPGAQTRGVFVYRTLEDLEAIIAYASQAATCAVLGGGLLGLEAARAVQSCGLQTHVVELAPRLMPRQLDGTGAKLLRDEIEDMGVSVHVGRRTRGIVGQERVTGDPHSRQPYKARAVKIERLPSHSS